MVIDYKILMFPQMKIQQLVVLLLIFVENGVKLFWYTFYICMN